MLEAIARHFPTPVSQVAEDILSYQQHTAAYDKYVHDRLYDLYEVAFRYITSTLWAVWNCWGREQAAYLQKTELLLEKLYRPSMYTWSIDIPQQLSQWLSDHPDPWVNKLCGLWETTHFTRLPKQATSLVQLSSQYLDNRYPPQEVFNFMSHYRNKLARGHGACLTPEAYRQLAPALEKMLVDVLSPYLDLFQDSHYQIRLITHIEWCQDSRAYRIRENRHGMRIHAPIPLDHWYIFKNLPSETKKKEPWVELIGDFGPLLLPLGLHQGWMLNHTPLNKHSSLSEYLSYVRGFFRRHPQRTVQQRLGFEMSPIAWSNRLALTPRPPEPDLLFQRTAMRERLPVHLLHGPTRTRLTAEQLLPTLAEHPLILIEAPGGYGKTELCRLLFEQLQSEQRCPLYLRLRDYHPQHMTLPRLLGQSVGRDQEEISLDQLQTSDVVLLCDGISELPLEYRQSCVQEISLLLQEYPGLPTLILGRNWQQEMDHLSRNLKRPYRLTLQPLDPETIAACLERHSSPQEMHLLQVHPQYQYLLNTPFLVLAYLEIAEKPQHMQPGSLLYALAQHLLRREQQQRGWTRMQQQALWEMACRVGRFLQHEQTLRWSRAYLATHAPEPPADCPAGWEDLLVESGLWKRVWDQDHFEFSHELLQELCAAEQMLHIWQEEPGLDFQTLVLPPRILRFEGKSYSSIVRTPISQHLPNFERFIDVMCWVNEEMKTQEISAEQHDKIEQLKEYTHCLESFVLCLDRASEVGVYQESQLLAYGLELLYLHSLEGYYPEPLLSADIHEQLYQSLGQLPIAPAEACSQLTHWLQRVLTPVYSTGPDSLRDNLSEAAIQAWEADPETPALDFDQLQGRWYYADLPQIFNHLARFPAAWLPELYPLLVGAWQNYPVPPHLTQLVPNDQNLRYRQFILQQLIDRDPQATWDNAMASLQAPNGGAWGRFLSQCPLMPDWQTPQPLLAFFKALPAKLLRQWLAQMPDFYTEAHFVFDRLLALQENKPTDYPFDCSLDRWAEAHLTNPFYCLFLEQQQLFQPRPVDLAASVGWLRLPKNGYRGCDFPWNWAIDGPLAHTLQATVEAEPPVWERHHEVVAAWFEGEHWGSDTFRNGCCEEVTVLGADWLARQFAHTAPTRSHLRELLCHLPPAFAYLLFDWLGMRLCHERVLDKAWNVLVEGNDRALAAPDWDRFQPVLAEIITHMCSLMEDETCGKLAQSWLLSLIASVTNVYREPFAVNISRSERWAEQQVQLERLNWLYRQLSPTIQLLVTDEYQQKHKVLATLPPTEEEEAQQTEAFFELLFRQGEPVPPRENPLIELLGDDRARILGLS